MLVKGPSEVSAVLRASKERACPLCVLQDLVDGLRSCVWVPLPEGWQEHMDPRTNQPYFVNTGTTTAPACLLQSQDVL